MLQNSDSDHFQKFIPLPNLRNYSVDEPIFVVIASKFGPSVFCTSILIRDCLSSQLFCLFRLLHFSFLQAALSAG
jgi:hypothetical protein